VISALPPAEEGVLTLTGDGSDKPKRGKKPPWAKVFIVEGDAAYGSQGQMKMAMEQDADDPGCTRGFLFAIPRLWKMVEGKAIKDLLTHLLCQYDRRTWLPRIAVANSRRSFCVYRPPLCLRHVGEVTVVLSKTRHSAGPSQTKILVTNLTEWTSR